MFLNYPTVSQSSAAFTWKVVTPRLRMRCRRHCNPSIIGGRRSAPFARHVLGRTQRFKTTHNTTQCRRCWLDDNIGPCSSRSGVRQTS